MNQADSNSRLSRIETLWSVIANAHGDDPDRMTAAQHKLLDLYGSAVRRYLLAATRNEDLADELFQQFACKFIAGDFKTADPSKGRFRSFVKTVLSRLIALHFRKRKRRREEPLKNEPDAKQVDSSLDDSDDQMFLASWREELLAQTWQRLENHERRTGVRYNTALRIRVAQPTLDSNALAEVISAAINRPLAAGAARVMIHRAREKFAELMIEVVAESLSRRDRQVVEAELIELGLIDYCREGLNRLAKEAGE